MSQLKLKIAEAKELAKTVVESEKYKTTLASFTPVVAKKEEKAEEKKTEETPKAVEETPAAATDAETPAVATTESPKEEAKEEAAKDVKADEGKKSTTNKRASIFGALLGGKKDKKEPEEKKVEEAKPVEEAKVTEEAATETPAVATETPAVEASTEAAKEPETAATEPVAEASETAAAKPTPSKRARYVFKRLNQYHVFHDANCFTASSVDCRLARSLSLRRPLPPPLPRTRRFLR